MVRLVVRPLARVAGGLGRKEGWALPSVRGEPLESLRWPVVRNLCKPVVLQHERVVLTKTSANVLNLLGFYMHPHSNMCHHIWYGPSNAQRSSWVSIG